LRPLSVLRLEYDFAPRSAAAVFAHGQPGAAFSDEASVDAIGRAARSGTRRLGLGMPRGRPRGLPGLPVAKMPARGAPARSARDQD